MVDLVVEPQTQRSVTSDRATSSASMLALDWSALGRTVQSITLQAIAKFGITPTESDACADDEKKSVAHRFAERSRT
ncbi:MAG: hypothetical protein IID35_00245 [Planctomycetes bacterium]|nr:hypothetical protein [Planctomycetota bacterium]